ncbi:MAG: biotin--[acetyl-CoA-carboxylase] ligase [bacterium]
MTWKKVLRLLTQEDRPISGERIGKSLNISRSAVWKQINYLNKMGFIIDSFPKSGYKLTFPKDTPVIVKPEDITAHLVGGQIISKIETASTNNDAISLAENAAEGTVLIAEYQREGRGRRGRSWISPFGVGLYFSIILKPQLPVAKLPKITILAGIALANALKKLEISVSLKWPNDIIINDRKVGGILSELFVEGDAAKYIVLGIGLNVHTKAKDFPEDLRNIAGSLFTETGKVYSRREILKATLTEFDYVYRYYLELNGELGLLAKQWNDMAWKRGEEVFITTGKEKEQCKIIGLQDDGTLLVSVKGKRKEVYAGEILFQ